MRTVGIICEYNPFHAGHKRQIDILRSMGYDCVVCVMSGNFVQRGELAIFDKYTRAEAAIAGGADVVLELPFPHSSLSAEGFADAGVHILASLGVDAISFGSECADIGALKRAAEAITAPLFKETYAEMQKSGIGSTAAYLAALKRLTGNCNELLSNDILAISYIAAIKKIGLDISIIPIKREGAAYNESSLRDGILPSASAIRGAIADTHGDIESILDGFVPDEVIAVLSGAHNGGLAPVSIRNIWDSVISFFKLMTPAELTSRAILRSGGGEHIAEDGCGICERICNAAKDSSSYDDFLKSCYTSKYPNARINRVILFSLLGVSDKAATTLPEYVTLLAASITGRKFLARARKGLDLTIVTKPADAPNGCLQKTLTEAADALYSSAFPTDISHDFFIKSRPFMQK